MDVVRFGRQVRARRRRRMWRQDDLASEAGTSRGPIARIEQGHGDRVTVATLDRVAAALGARVICRLEWNAEALDRLLDADHAAVVEKVLRLLVGHGWLCASEVSFNIAGERGSIDILAWHRATGALLVVEVKSVVPDIQLTLVTLDRKGRLATRIARERGWEPRSVSRLLVIREDRTSRRRVAAHAAIFGNAFPQRATAVRRWLAHPSPGHPIAGLWFLTSESHAVPRYRVARARTAVRACARAGPRRRP